FFKLLAKAVPVMQLERLTLSNITTRYKYLALFLHSCRATLRFFKLSMVDLTRENDGIPFFQYLRHELKLDGCVLKRLNVGSHGINFGEVEKQRPYCMNNSARAASACLLDGDGWVHVENPRRDTPTLSLRVTEYDDVDEWLAVATKFYDLTGKWLYNLGLC
ncbi:hypothetical protein CC86DRAFT_285349, partial [Ophiobolus disseminans]